MNVLLVQSSVGPDKEIAFPLGLAYLAASLPEHNVRMLDLNSVASSEIALQDTIDDFHPDVIGLSFRNTDDQNREKFTYYYRDYFKAEVRLIKQFSPKSYLVVGGSAFSLFPDGIMENNPLIDFGVYLEAEESFPALLGNIDAPWNVKGVYYRENGTVQFTGPAKLPDLKNLPFPRRDLVDLSHYAPLQSIGIQTTRGCCHKCSYCVYPYLNGTIIRRRTPASVVDEIETLVRDHNISQFIFADSSFGIAREEAHGICNEIINRKLRVQWGAYFDMQSDEAFLRLAKKAGCTFFVFSPDGYSDAALRSLGKNLTSQAVREHLEMMLHHPDFKDADILYCFMLNPPGETLAGLLKTLWFTLGVRLRIKMGAFRRFRVNLSWIRLEPHTDIFRSSCKQGDVLATNELLPENPKDINKLFYRHPRLHFADELFLAVKQMKHLLNKIKRSSR